MSKGTMGSKAFWETLAILVAGFAIVGCGGSGSAKRGGTLNAAIEGDPGVLAFDVGTTPAIPIAANLFDGLTDVDPDSGKILTKVADSWTSSNGGKTWTFELKDDYRFCNGEPVTAESFKVGWSASADPERESSVAYNFIGIKGTDDAGYSKNLTGVTTPGKYTLKVELTKGINFFDAQVVNPVFSPVPVKYFKKHKQDFTDKPVGNGPFCVTSYKHDRAVETRANKYYKGADRTTPSLSRLVFKIYPDDQASYKAFQANDVQVSFIPYEKIKQAQAMPSANYVSRSILATGYLGFRVNKAPFGGAKGKLVRQAISYAIDKDSIAENVLNGSAKPATGFTPPGIDGYKPNLSPYDYDPAKAKELLKEAGYPNGKGLPELELGYPAEASNDLVASAAQKDLDAVGVKVKPKGYPDFVGTYIPGIIDGDITFFDISWGADYPNYYNFLYPNFDSETIPDGDLYYWKNKEFDRLLDEASTTGDPDKATSLYNRAEEILFEDPPIVALTFNNAEYVVADDVEGFEITSMDLIPYEKVSLK